MAENYQSRIDEQSKSSLGDARGLFATYVKAIHARIHPFFADSFLCWLNRLPESHPMNDQSIFTRLEIILSGENGDIDAMGVVKRSGVDSFDVAALESVARAAPFGPAPTKIISADGNVYVTWEFHRDPVFACSLIFTRPFLLNGTAPEMGADWMVVRRRAEGSPTSVASGDSGAPPAAQGPR